MPKCKAIPSSKLDAVARSHGEASLYVMCGLGSSYAYIPNKVRISSSRYRVAGAELFRRVSKIAWQTVNSALSNLHKCRQKPEAQRHVSLHLDGQPTIQTERRFLSSMPANPEELRVKYKIMAHCWFLAQKRQPGRHLYSDFARMTFIDFLDELLSERSVLMDKNHRRQQGSPP